MVAPDSFPSIPGCHPLRILYDDLVGFTLEFVYRRVVAVGRNVYDHIGFVRGSCIEFYGESFELLKTIGSVGSGEGQLQQVMGLCFDKSRKILFASDYGNGRIHKIDENRQFLCCFGGEVLKYPQQLSLSPDCSTLAVGGFVRKEVLVFSAETGELLRRSGAVFKYPGGVCHLSTDELLVAEEKRVLLLEAASLKMKSEWKSIAFIWQVPYHIAVAESKGVVLICDDEANRVAQFSKSGDYLSSIASHGGEQLIKPGAIAVDAARILFVSCDDGIRVFDEANSKFSDRYVNAIDL